MGRKLANMKIIYTPYIMAILLLTEHDHSIGGDENFTGKNNILYVKNCDI